MSRVKEVSLNGGKWSEVKVGQYLLRRSDPGGRSGGEYAQRRRLVLWMEKRIFKFKSQDVIVAVYNLSICTSFSGSS